MTEISPNYYASGVGELRYSLIGHRFDLIPNDALGIMAEFNNDPLELIDTENDGFLYRITEKSDEQIEMEQIVQGSHSVPTYLGAIVSLDRKTIYWINDTKPLP